MIIQKDLIEPKLITIKSDGGERKYIISKFPAVAGREIVANYALSALPKVGDYKANEATMFKLMTYVATEDGITRLSTRDLIDNQVDSWEALKDIEKAMMEYNCSFFRDGSLSGFLGGFVQRVLALISPTSTDSSEPSSKVTKQPSTN